jgi:hypothetical protein
MTNNKISKLKNIIQLYTNTANMTNNKLAVEWLAKSYVDLLTKLNNEEISLKEFEIQYIELLEQAKEMHQKETTITENTSDGYHTFKELYEFRKAYNVALFNEWGSQKERQIGNQWIPLNTKNHVHKSWKHHDGELCFGGGWFIVVAVLPTGQISNHYKAEDWDLFNIPEVEKALFPFDGHTSEDVIKRLLES